MTQSTLPRDLCPCGSGQPFSQCCQPFLHGDKLPQTCEQLMRSRYTAYTQAVGAYLVKTHHSSFRGNVSAEAWTESARQTHWVNLQVLASNGGAADQSGEVEFKAWHREGNQLCLHHELSAFSREQGQWRYTEGKVLTARRFQPNRNDPCPCGSGRKFKKCCGS